MYTFGKTNIAPQGAPTPGGPMGEAKFYLMFVMIGKVIKIIYDT